MFRYLIGRCRRNQTSIVTAITSTDDVITTYTQIPNQGNPFTTWLKDTPLARHAQKFAYLFSANPTPDQASDDKYRDCIQHHTIVRSLKTVVPKFALDQPAFQDKNTFFHSDKLHKAIHSKEPHEADPHHLHIKYGKPMTALQIRHFLTELQGCELSKNLPEGINFISAELIDDIVSQFEKYKALSSSSTARIHRSSLFNASNIPEYETYSPPLAEHALCLSIPQASGCTPDNPFTQKLLTLSATGTSATSASTFSMETAVAGVIGLAVFAFFCCKKKKPPSVKEKFVAERKKARQTAIKVA